MTEVRKYYKEIDSLKGFAIFLVVLGHAIIYFPIDLHEIAWCETLFKMLSGIHMPLFFAVSGYCFSYRGNYLNFLSKKAKRLLLPYVIFNMIDLVPRALLPQFVNRPQSLAESVQSILLNGGAYWFLYTLFLIFAFYPVIYKWQEGSKRRMVITTVGCSILAFIRIPTETFTLHLASGYLFFFHLGVLLKMNRVRIFECKMPKTYQLVPLGVAILWLVLLFSPWERQLEGLVSLLGITVCAFLTCFKPFNDIFERFGKFSLQLYLLNGFLLVISRTIICRLTADPALIIGFNMLVDFVLAYLAIKYICARIKLFRVLMGME